ncbi:MAG TPA: hypothetical protein PLX06_13820 [Fimbriimonadaceae bacterium]|nr:hypothetical protein [Fimbriimonadaceae bacterium]
MRTTKNAFKAMLTALVLSAFPWQAQAQYNAIGADGIAASPKQRQFLDEQSRRRNPRTSPAAAPSMPCPMCKDKTTTKTDYSARGATKPVITVTTHLCKGCVTEWSLTGHGKAKTSIASHRCTACGADDLACCNTTKGSTVATKGMEKPVQIAPLK